MPPFLAEALLTSTCLLGSSEDPYREHALISRQEHEAWDVLLASQGQLRLVLSGRVIGIDIDAALSIAAAAVAANLPYFQRGCRRLRQV